MRFRKAINGGMVTRQAKQIDGEETSHAKAKIRATRIASPALSGQRLKLSTSTSAKTGVAPTRTTASALATNVKAGTMTASTGPDPQSRQGEFEGVGAIRTGDALPSA